MMIKMKYIITWKDNNGRIRATEIQSNKNRLPSRKEAEIIILEWSRNEYNDPNKHSMGVIDVHSLKKGEIFE